MQEQDPVFVLIGENQAEKRKFYKRWKDFEYIVESFDASQIEPHQLWDVGLFTSIEKPTLKKLFSYSKWSAKQRNQFAQLITECPAGVYVIVETKQLGAKDPLRIVNQENIIECKDPDPKNINQWISDYLQDSNLTLSNSQISWLAMALDNNTDLISSEIDKLSPLGKLDDVQLKQLVADQSLTQVWGWIEACIKGDISKSLNNLSKLESQDSNVFMALGALQQRLASFAWFELKIDDKELKMHPYALKQAKLEFKKYSWSSNKIKNALDLIAQTQKNLKSSGTLPDWVLMTELSLKICQL